MIAFFDASALIYLIEGAKPSATRFRHELATWSRKHANSEMAVSRWSWLECRAGPARHNDLQASAAYDAFFARAGLYWVEIAKDVIELATAIRVRHGLRTPDCLQAASGLQLGEEHVFFTGDVGFARVERLNARLLK